MNINQQNKNQTSHYHLTSVFFDQKYLAGIADGNAHA